MDQVHPIKITLCSYCAITETIINAPICYANALLSRNFAS